MKARLKHRRLSQELLKRNISQNRWAQKLGLSRGHLSMLVNGRRPYPSAKTRLRLLQGTGLNFDDLFELVDEVRAPSLQKGVSAAPSPPRTATSKGDSPLKSWLGDIRLCIRHLIHDPTYSWAAILTLALGIGASSAVFSLFNGVLLRDLPFPQPQELVRLWEAPTKGSSPYKTLSLPNFEDWRSSAGSFQSMAVIDLRPYTTRMDGRPEQIWAARVSDNFFDVLGVQPHQGRLFRAGEDDLGADSVAVVSFDFWRSRLGGREDAVGTSIRLDQRKHLLVGVLPERFEDPTLSPQGPQVWIPFQTDLSQWHRSGRSIDAAFARLKPDSSLHSAREEMSSIAAALARQHPQDNEGATVRLSALSEDMVGGFRPPAYMLMGAVALVLAVACVNVANLSLGRALSRRREMAIRMALGAHRTGLARLLLTESLILALAGGAAGLLLAWTSTGWLVGLAGGSIPRAAQIEPDGRVLLFALAVSILTGLAFGLAPALRLSGLDLRSRWNDGGQWRLSSARRFRLRSALLAGEAALSALLLVGCGLLCKSFWSLLQVDTGMSTEKVLRLQVVPPSPQYQSKQQVDRLYNGLIPRLQALPGVASASAVDRVPLGTNRSRDSFTIEGRPEPETPSQTPMAETRAAFPGYLRTMGIKLMRGRPLLESDHSQAAKVALVNQALAQRHWGSDDPIGQRIRIHGEWRSIVGVFGDARIFGPAQETPDQVLLSWPQDDWGSWRMDMVVRTAGDPARSGELARNAVHELDPEVPVDAIGTMNALLNRNLASPRFRAVLLTMFALAAVSLAAVGIAGVLACFVNRRSKEIGVRMAVGAREVDVAIQVVSNGLKPAALGTLVGLAMALALSPAIEGMLFEVDPIDPLIYGLAAATLLATAFVGCYSPARRASRLDPIRALRRN